MKTARTLLVNGTAHTVALGAGETLDVPTWEGIVPTRPPGPRYSAGVLLDRDDLRSPEVAAGAHAARVVARDTRVRLGAGPAAFEAAYARPVRVEVSGPAGSRAIRVVDYELWIRVALGAIAAYAVWRWRR